MREGRFVRGEVFPDPEQAVARFAAEQMQQASARRLSAAGAASAAQLGQRRVALLVHRDRRFDPGDLRAAAGPGGCRSRGPGGPRPRRRSSRCQARTIRAIPVESMNSHSERSSTIEASASAERRVELPLELRRRVHVQLAADGERANSALELLALHLEGNWAHRPILPQGGRRPASGRCPSRPRWFVPGTPRVAEESQKSDDYARSREGTVPRRHGWGPAQTLRRSKTGPGGCRWCYPRNPRTSPSSATRSPAWRRRSAWTSPGWPT